MAQQSNAGSNGLMSLGMKLLIIATILAVCVNLFTFMDNHSYFSRYMHQSNAPTTASKYAVKAFGDHTSILDRNGNSKSDNTNNSMPTPNDYYNPKTNRLSSGQRIVGFERAEDHWFKSPYIVTPNVGREESTTPVSKVSTANRTVKRISFYALSRYNGWLQFHLKKQNNFRHCPYSECELDVLGESIPSAHLVVFVCKGLGAPPPRQKNQLWALACFESAKHWNYQDYETMWKDGVNITISYRLDSDLVVPYSRLHWRDSSTLLQEDKYDSIARRKRKDAVWIVSNCQRDRWLYVKEMQKYMDIDIFGACSNRKYPLEEKKIGEMLTTTYKFYLAFENSFCQDYITEKFFKTFNDRTYILPVAKGAVDVDKYFPANTLVNGNKFKSAKDLALYLKDLGNDVDRYASMLREKDKLVASRYAFDMLCGMCQYLHGYPVGFHRDIRSWSHINNCGASRYKIKP